MQKKKKYYEGEHKILDEAERKNKLVCNHAKDIADTASSYFIGNPVSYKSSADIAALTEPLELAGQTRRTGITVWICLFTGSLLSIFTQKEGETDLIIKNLSPENTFMVYDDSIEENELFAVYYSIRKDDGHDTKIIYVATVVTKNFRYVLDIEDIEGPQALLEEPEPHYMDEVPIVAYQNNKLGIGDYELQIPLIDAYNALMSDRVTDKEQFVDAILALYGFMLGDENGKDADGRTAPQRLKEDRLLEMPADARAEYITRTFDESGVEILKKAIEQDIHKFSHIPCMSDESFGGNVSGVAMSLNSLEWKTLRKLKRGITARGCASGSVFLPISSLKRGLR